MQLISEVIYMHSTVMDGRWFAEEYVRRKKLAEKGVVDKRSAGSMGVAAANGEDGGSGDGWNVVRRGGGGSAASGAAPAQEDTALVPGATFKAFKDVPSRKKRK